MCFPTFTLHLSHCLFHNVHDNCLQKLPGKWAFAKKILWCNLLGVLKTCPEILRFCHTDVSHPFSCCHLWCPDMSFIKPAVDSMVVLSFVESWNVLRKASSRLHGRHVYCGVLKVSFVKPAGIGKSLGTTSRVAFLFKSQENEFLIALSCFQVVVFGIGPRPCKILANKVIRKVRDRRHWNPLFGPVWSHRGRGFQKHEK